MRNTFLPIALCMLSFSLAGGCATRIATQPVAPPSPAASQTFAPKQIPAEVESWVKPESGWLYVLDPQPQPDDPAGRIWLLDPATAKVMGSVRTGNSPDFALSPDGARLYVAALSSATDGQSSEIAMIDTASGMVVERGAIENRVTANGIPSFSSMAVSRDGLALRILVNSFVSPDTDGFQLATFDTESGNLLPAHVHLGNCGYGQFISYPDADQFDFFCPTTNRIRFIRVDAQSRELEDSFVVLPWPRRFGVAEAFPGPGGQDTTIIRGDGAIFKMNGATQKFAATPAHGDIQGRIFPAVWPSSPDGSRIYLGYNRSPDTRFYLDYDRSAELHPRFETADEFQVYDTSTWRRLGTIKTQRPFWSAVAGNDGKSLYELAPNQHSVLVIDTATMREVRSIPLGGMPALALVAP